MGSILNRISPLAFQQLRLYQTRARASLLFPRAIERNFGALLTLASFEELLTDNTHFPLFAPYLLAEDRERLRLNYQLVPKPYIAHTAGMARFPGLASGRVRVCRFCVAECDEKNRIPIWRRAAVLPGILHCPRHNERYLDLCGTCVNGFPASTAPLVLRADACVCDAPLRLIVPVMSLEGEAASIRVSQALQHAIEGGFLHFSQGDMQEIYARRSRELGLNRSSLGKLVRDTGIEELSTRLGLNTGYRDFLGQCLRGVRVSANPILNALIQCALFSEPRELIEFDRQEQKPALSEKRLLRLATVKQRVVDILEAQPGITRAELHDRIHPRDMKLLLAEESEWLDALIPVTHKSNLKGPRIPDWSSIDEKTAKFIEGRYVELLSAPDLPRITQRRLLDGCPGGSVFRARADHLPKSAALLKGLTERSEEHSLRRMRTWMPEIPNPEELSHRARLVAIQRWRKRT
ncbi:hypothetical protein [Cupriavidus necator]|uniref:hypothetical protein n=1 Tax=Cupriavidus necator TaxID=106590 RepID=UPI000F4D99A3|nr:hypothetical protein [Cupriavidus necator]